MRWAREQRIKFIQAHLSQHGEITRRDLQAKFRISTPQASSDFRVFMDIHPGAMWYSRSKKRYCAPRLPVGGRDTTAAAKNLIYADDAWIQQVALRDPGMIRDVAAALICERTQCIK